MGQFFSYMLYSLSPLIFLCIYPKLCSTLQNVDIEKERELERQARIEASLREREREVQKARSEQTKEIDREREQHKREEAIQHFKALMSDMVRRSLFCIIRHFNITSKVC